MDAFLVPLPATTSGSAPENKQFYFLYFDTICWHAIRHNLQKSVPPPAIGSSYVKLRFIFDTIDGMFYTECTSKSQTYAVVIVKLFHSCKHSYFVSVCRFQTTFCGVEYNLRFHSRFGTRFHFDEHFQCKRFLLCITDVYLGAFRDKNSTYALTNTENSTIIKGEND